MADGASCRLKPRLWRLQFSLASVFVLMTLSAIGVWFWYQRPYEVENKELASAPAILLRLRDTPPGFPAPVRREVETVRRVWGGKTVRHGPRRIYDGTGKLSGHGELPQWTARR